MNETEQLALDACVLRINHLEAVNAALVAALETSADALQWNIDSHEKHSVAEGALKEVRAALATARCES